MQATVSTEVKTVRVVEEFVGDIWAVVPIKFVTVEEPMAFFRTESQAHAFGQNMWGPHFRVELWRAASWRRGQRGP